MERKFNEAFVIKGDETIDDFLKYLDAVGVSKGNKSFYSALKNQIKAYRFTVSGGSETGWRLSDSLNREVKEK